MIGLRSLKSDLFMQLVKVQYVLTFLYIYKGCGILEQEILKNG